MNRKEFLHIPMQVGADNFQVSQLGQAVQVVVERLGRGVDVDVILHQLLFEFFKQGSFGVP